MTRTEIQVATLIVVYVACACLFWGFFNGYHSVGGAQPLIFIIGFVLAIIWPVSAFFWAGMTIAGYLT